MVERKACSFGSYTSTRDKIIEVATQKFALHGYSNTSMREIAKTVDIKMASLYYYFDSKEEILEEILSIFEEDYTNYINWLSDKNSQAKSFEEVVDNLFNEEFVNMLNPLCCMGMTLAIKEQYTNQIAHKCVNDLIYIFSIESLKADFNNLIKKEIIYCTDTEMIATLFMFCIIVCNDIRVHSFMGKKSNIDSEKIISYLKKFVFLTLKRENLS